MMTAAPSARSVCVIEDNDQFRSALLDWLRLHGFTAVGFINGQDFPRTANQNQNHFNLIVSDVHMAEMDGLELLLKLQDMAVKTPVIMMSSSLEKTLPGICIDQGASAYLSKPFEGEKLIAVMEEIWAQD